jgi:hypothetical protein
MAYDKLSSLELQFEGDLTNEDKIIIRYMKNMLFKGTSILGSSSEWMKKFIHDLRTKNDYIINLYEGRFEKSLNNLNEKMRTDPKLYLQSVILCNLLLLKEVESESIHSKVLFRKYLMEEILNHSGDDIHLAILDSHL